MEQRYQDMKASRVRHIDDFNRKVRSGEITAPLGSNATTKPVSVHPRDRRRARRPDDDRSPRRRDAIVRITQKRVRRASTWSWPQRPSVDVVTGSQDERPSRLAFATSSLTDSRVILDQPGAEKLIGMGDPLLAHGCGSAHPDAGAFVADEGSPQSSGTAANRFSQVRRPTCVHHLEGRGQEGLRYRWRPRRPAAGVRLVVVSQSVRIDVDAPAQAARQFRQGGPVDGSDGDAWGRGSERGSKAREVLEVKPEDLARVIASITGGMPAHRIRPDSPAGACATGRAGRYRPQPLSCR